MPSRYSTRHRAAGRRSTACYLVRAGSAAAREVLVSSAPAIRVSRISRIVRGGLAHRSKEYSYVFAVLRRSRRVQGGGRRASGARHRRAVPGTAARRPRRPRRARRAHQVAHRLGQDAGLRHPAGRSHRRGRPAPRGPHPRPHPGAGEPDRRRARSTSAAPARSPSPRSTAAPASSARAGRRAKAPRPRRHARPARGPDGPGRRVSASGARSSSSTRPTGCSS